MRPIHFLLAGLACASYVVIPTNWADRFVTHREIRRTDSPATPRPLELPDEFLDLFDLMDSPNFINAVATRIASKANLPEQYPVAHQLLNQLRKFAGISTPPPDIVRPEQVDPPYGPRRSEVSVTRPVLQRLNAEAGISAVSFPNLGINQIERVLEFTGNATNDLFSSLENVWFRATRPIEDARTLAMIARDLAIADRLDRRGALVSQIQDNVLNVLTSNLDQMVDGVDEVLGRTVLLPATATLNAAGRIQRRIQDAPAHAAIVMACYANPECCINPELCFEM